MKRIRYIVISYDKDQQQTFHDLITVDAEADDTGSDAEAIAARMRPYATPVAVLSEEDLRDMTGKLLHADGQGDLPFAQQVRYLSRERCAELLDTHLGVGVRDEQTLASLREEVRAALENGDIDAALEELTA